MAIQAQLYNSENMVGLAFCGSGYSSSQDWMMMMMENASSSGGGGGGFNQFKQQQIHQFQQNHHQNQNQNQGFFFENGASIASIPSLKNNNNEENSYLSMPISVQVEKQRQEIDHYIRSQNERLRLLLQEQRKQQLEMMLKKIESKAVTLLRQKDEEIAKANNRTMELEILLKRLEMENQAWQRMAQEYESMVFSLNATIEQMREKATTASCCFFNNGAAAAEDAESCCDVEDEEQQQQHQQEHENEKAEENRLIGEKKLMMVCKGCNSGDSCVLFLPCRHLCACKACAAFLDSCPVCLAPKKASIEALIS